MFDHGHSGDTHSGVDQGIYSSQSSVQTYSRLQTLASDILNSGYSVIVDAAFLKHEQRKPFQLLAESLGLRYNIIEITAPVEILRQRIIARKNDVSDADIAVLEHQLSSWQPLLDSELASAIAVNTAEPFDVDTLIEKVNAKD